MIRALRVRHRFAAAAMAIGLPVLFVAGLAARPPPRQMAAVPVLAAEDLGAWTVTGFRDQMFGSLPMRWNQVADADPPVRAAVELKRSKPLDVPAPLLYWSAAKPPDDGSLPEAALLAGPVGSAPTQRIALPPNAVHENGWLIVYSLAHAEVAAAAAWPSLVFNDEGTSP